MRSERREAKLYARLGLTPGAGDREVELAHAELVSFLEGAPDGVRGWAEGEIAAADEARALLSGAHSAAAPRRHPAYRRAAAAIATLVVSIGIVVAVYNIGGQGEGDSGSPGAAEAQRLGPADQARVSRLIGKLDANPRDVASLVTLGDVYFKAGDYSRAGGWIEQAVAVEPDNVRARLALGAALFNLGDASAAQRHRLRVIAIDPGNIEARYDLGFLYLSRKPPDMAQAKRMWRRVVELAPDSPVAKTVATHLRGLKR
jgi:cytochrome c-type biogenesis protein CcmH/NrfG